VFSFFCLFGAFPFFGVLFPSRFCFFHVPVPLLVFLVFPLFLFLLHVRLWVFLCFYLTLLSSGACSLAFLVSISPWFVLPCVIYFNRGCFILCLWFL
jgi:hypothetical protein